jgi:hypothetical protein
LPGVGCILKPVEAVENIGNVLARLAAMSTGTLPALCRIPVNVSRPRS